ncbi:hypothetical protein PsorP6_016752 [Peronosclerospora sorghi]|uniref:Uncharacterized protein n=1 Tax=Peronosclerospora sorghi TaxID=230839 RepID=A0ACC0WDT7_9STRA|nr:hypothetical protein PsorP6_016752 [Peronosclerospora sorghi]
MERARCFSRQGKRLNEIAKGTKDEVQFAIHRTVRNVLERALDIVAARWKEKVKIRICPIFMPDVKMEIFRKTRDLFGTDAKWPDQGGDRDVHVLVQDMALSMWILHPRIRLDAFVTFVAIFSLTCFHITRRSGGR